MAESGCTSKVSTQNYNGTYDYGVFQINSVHANRVGGNLNALLDPDTNIRIAAQLYSEQSWYPWVTFNTGRYRRYLK